MEEKLRDILSSYEGKKSEIIPILQDVQGTFGFLPEKVMLEVSSFLGLPESHLYGVASFYAQFRFTPIGKKHIMVCRGTACHVRNAPQILDEIKRELGIDEGETTSDGEYSLETVACIGCCALAPCITINGEVKAKVTPRTVKECLFEGSINE